MTAKLSNAAESALLSAHPRQGAVPTTGELRELTELALNGLIGNEGGLTRKGLIARERIVDARLEEAF